MRSENAKSSVDEMHYMAQNGEWEDIPFMAKAEKGYYGRPPFSPIYDLAAWSRHISSGIYAIGGHRLDELLTVEMPAAVLIELIKIAAGSRFSEIPDNVLMARFHNINDNVRKCAALKSVLCLKKSRLKELLSLYLEQEEHIYYYVILWLDFGVALPRQIAGKAVQRIFKDL